MTVILLWQMANVYSQSAGTPPSTDHLFRATAGPRHVWIWGEVERGGCSTLHRWGDAPAAWGQAPAPSSSSTRRFGDDWRDTARCWQSRARQLFPRPVRSLRGHPRTSRSPGLGAGAFCCDRPVRFYSLSQAGVGSFSSQVPGSVPADKDASRLLVSKEFPFLSSFLMLLLASNVGKSLPQSQGQSRKKKKGLFVRFYAIETMGCALLKTLRCVRIKIKTTNYLLNINPSAQRGAQSRKKPLSHSSGRQRQNTTFINNNLITGVF